MRSGATSRAGQSSVRRLVSRPRSEGGTTPDTCVVSTRGPPTNLPSRNRSVLPARGRNRASRVATMFSIMFSEIHVTKHSASQAPNRPGAGVLAFSFKIRSVRGRSASCSAANSSHSYPGAAFRRIRHAAERHALWRTVDERAKRIVGESAAGLVTANADRPRDRVRSKEPWSLCARAVAPS